MIREGRRVDKCDDHNLWNQQSSILHCRKSSQLCCWYRRCIIQTVNIHLNIEKYMNLRVTVYFYEICKCKWNAKRFHRLCTLRNSITTQRSKIKKVILNGRKLGVLPGLKAFRWVIKHPVTPMTATGADITLAWQYLKTVKTASYSPNRNHE